MPKSKCNHVGKSAKLIYKNSRSTMNTSRTYSGASQMFTKSLILQLKRHRPNEDYYEENGTVKRNLSIETDICILRGYYKKRRNKLIIRKSISKYSINQIDTIDDIKYDNSGCGDSKVSVQFKNTHFNTNVTSLVVQNLKKMLNDWVKKYLLESDDTKQKIDSVLDSLLHKLDIERKETVSSCTYTVDIELYQKREEKEIISCSLNSQALKRGSFSVPLGGKNYRILSTLSVPKNIYKQKTSLDSWNNFNKIRHKKILLSTNGSSKYLFTSSSLNFLTFPTEFFTKCCATYQNYRQDIIENNKGKQKSIVLPDALKCDKNLDCFTAMGDIDIVKYNINNEINAQISALNTIPSIHKNMYNDEIHDFKIINQSTENVNKQDVHNSVPLIPIDLKNQSFELAQSKELKYEELHNSDLIRDIVNKKSKKNSKRNKKIVSRLLKHKNKKSKMSSSPKLGEYVKLDIQVNVYPSNNRKTEKDAVNTCAYSHPLVTVKTTPPNTEIMNEDSVPYDHKIIPLLDGAVSQANYIVSGEISTNSSKNINHVDSPAIDYIAKESKIAQEIGEIKLIIKALANTTEKLVNEHLTKKSFRKDILKQNSIDNTQKLHVDLEKICKPSMGVQVSSKFVKNCIIGSGINIKKLPKKKHKEYNPRLMKRSTSYNIIDSESILKVTDMTSAAQGEINIQCRVDRALTCSLPRMKSLYEVSVGTNDEKVAALPDSLNRGNKNGNDNFSKPVEYVYNVCELKPRTSILDKTQHVKSECNETNTKTEHKSETFEVLSMDDGCDEKTVCIDIETKTRDKKMAIRHTGVTFWGGCLYCIYLWIPLLTILWLFYEYVLKNYLPENFPLRKLKWPEEDIINESFFRLTLADLGF